MGNKWILNVMDALAYLILAGDLFYSLVKLVDVANEKTGLPELAWMFIWGILAFVSLKFFVFVGDVLAEIHGKLPERES